MRVSSKALQTAKITASAMLLSMVAGTSFAETKGLADHAILGKMKPDDRYPFVAGIIEGIAFHRYTVGNKDKAGMDCVYDWFYKDEKADDDIYTALAKFPTYPPAAVIAVLAKKKCGGE